MGIMHIRVACVWLYIIIIIINKKITRIVSYRRFVNILNVGSGSRGDTL